MPATCALDVIDEHGPQGLSDIAKLVGLTREMVRQIEIQGAQHFLDSGFDQGAMGVLYESAIGLA